MTITLIINTCADLQEQVISSGRVPYGWRAYALQNFILPAYCAESTLDEVIVVGDWHEGEGYKYIPCPVSDHKSGVDSIPQRQVGFEAATGDILIFQHDDHFLDLGSLNNVMPSMPADVLAPARYTRLRNIDGERLNDGSEAGYVNGHCAIYKREVIETCPWNKLPEVFPLDIEHTKQILAAGFTIKWTDDIQVWDVECGAEPWK